MSEELKQPPVETQTTSENYYLSLLSETDRSFLENKVPPEVTNVMILEVVLSAYLSGRKAYDGAAYDDGTAITEFRKNHTKPEWWQAQEKRLGAPNGDFPGLQPALTDNMTRYVAACRAAVEKSAG